MSREGHPVAGVATQPRRLAVLALISRSGDRGISREKLLALLWPDSDDESARASLSQALSTLRRELGDGDLFAGVQSIRLNQASASCDALDFEAALAAGNPEQAVASYGGPFLEGFRIPGADELDRWIEEERTGLAARYADALEGLGRQALQRGDAVAAVSWWRRRAALDPLNARVTLELMRALVAAGERHGAIQQARIYEALLQQELALAPDAEVVRYAETLRNPPAGPSSVAPPPVASTPIAPNSSPEVPTLPAAPAPVAADPPIAPARRRSRRRIAAGAVVLAVLLVSALALQALRRSRPPAPVLAVGRIVDYRDEGDGVPAPVSDMLATNLARVQGLQVISSLRLLELAGPAGGPDDPALALAAAARTAGASEVLDGGLHALANGRLLLELRRVDLSGGAVRSAYRLEGTDVFELVRLATREVSTSLGFAAGTLDPGDVSTRSLVSYRFYEEGLRSFVRGDYRGAHRLFDAAVAEDSNFAMAGYYRWLSMTPLGLPLPPGEVERIYRLAERATERERLLIRGFVTIATQGPGLLAMAETLAVRYPAEVDGQYLLGYGRQMQGEYALAVPHLERVLRMDSTTGSAGGRCRRCDAIEQLTHAWYALDSLPKAEGLLRRWIAQDSLNARPWAALATLLAVTQRYDEALEAWRRATTAPFNVYDEIFPASLEILRGDFPAADRALAAMQQSNRTVSVEALWHSGISLRYQARWTEALELLRSRSASLTGAERAGDHGYLPKLAEGLVLFEAGRLAQATRLWDSIARNPNPALRTAGLGRRQIYLYVLMAEAAGALGDLPGAARAADSAGAWAERTGNPRDARVALHARGVASLAAGDTAAAVRTLTDAIFSPTVGFTRSNLVLGRVLLAQGRAEDARRWVAPALRGTLEGANLYVTRTELHEVMAATLDALGRRDSAQAHRRQVAGALSRSDPEARHRLERARSSLP